MKKIRFKRLVCLFFVVFISVSYAHTIVAEDYSPSLILHVFAKAAIIDNVSENGSTIGDDLHVNTNTDMLDTTLEISVYPGNELKITTHTGDYNISVLGLPVAKSANKHAIYYRAVSNNSSFKVVNMEYVDNAETNMFFKDYKSKSNAKKILKLYLRDLTSDSRKYILLECFDYQIENFGQLISTLPQDTPMGAWAAKEFVPMSISYEDNNVGIIPSLYTNNTVRTYSIKYNDLSLIQTHTITLATDCTYGNIPVGQTARIVYLIEITGKTLTCPGNPSLNSKTESYLHVDTLSLRQTTVPYVAFISTSIDGKVQNNSFFGPSLSASIGVSFGALGLSLSVPVSFSGSDTIDINSTYDSYVNGRNGRYVRSIKTTMSNNYKLTQIGHYFAVESTIGDFGNLVRKSTLHKATWDISIINAANMSTQSKIIHQNVNISIQK